MQQVYENLNAAHEELNKLSLKADQKMNQAIAAQELADDQKRKQDKREEGLMLREAKVSQIENASNLKSEAQSLMAEAQELMAQAKDQAQKTSQAIAIETDKLNNLRYITKQEEDNLTKRKANLEQEVSDRVAQCLKNMGIKK